MPNYSTQFQDHHGIEQQTLKNSALLAKLEQAGKFDIHASQNRLFLPANPQFAQAMGITPHSGGPLGAYQKGMLDRLGYFQRTRDGQAVLEGDPDAMDRMAKRVEQLRDTVKVGLINGDLNTNTPVGSSPALTSQKVRQFFDNIPAYHQVHAQQIETLKGFKGVDHGWGAVAHSESRIVTTLNQIHVDSRPLIRGGDIELQRSGLSLAIANAHHDGRVVMSEPGIRRVELVLGEESAYRIRVHPSQQGAVSIELLMGEASARTLVRSGGLLATGVDAIMTARRSAELLEQGNTTAAQSELNHAVARNVGGWAGGASTAMALGGSGFVPAAVVAADALLLSKAFERGADLLDNRAIYHQTDKAGVEWQFNGRNWERQAAMDRTSDGLSNPVQQSVVASYQKSQELGAMASAKAVELALGKAPPPQDPFKIPAQASDQRGLDNQDWHRNADTLQWERQVKSGLSGTNDRGSYESQVATPERARQLNQEALGRIEGNIATGREAIAAAYVESHAAQRAQDHDVAVPVPVALAQAKPNAVLGSDDRLYQRNEAGQWASQEGLASGNLAVELELTSQMRQPSLQRSQQELAAIQALAGPTAAQAEQNELLHRYRSAGIDLNVNPQTQQAIELAVDRTLASSGVSGLTMQQLQRSASGQYGYDSPIIHYQTGPDGVARQVAITSSDELRQAWNEVRTQRQDSPPIPDSPELRITALSPKEQDAHRQALHEANRLGAASVDAQQVATNAVREVRGVRFDEAHAPGAELSTHRENHPGHDVDAPAQTPAVAANATKDVPPRETQSDGSASIPAPTITHTKEVHQPRDAATSPNQDASPPYAAPASHAGKPEPAPEHISNTGNLQTPPPRDVLETAPALTASNAQAMGAGQQPHTPAIEVLERDHGRDVPLVGLNAASVPSEGALQEHVHNPTPTSLEAMMLSEEVPFTREGSPPAPPTHPDHAVHDQVRQPVNEIHEDRYPAQAGHSDHALYLQVREGVAALDAKHGRGFDAVSERMTASLLVLAKDNDLDRVDHVLLSNATTQNPEGHTLFVVQGEPGNPAHLRAAMPTEQAAQTSVEESMQQFDVVSQEAHQRTLANQLEQQIHDERVQQDIQVRAASMG